MIEEIRNKFLAQKSEVDSARAKAPFYELTGEDEEADKITASLNDMLDKQYPVISVEQFDEVVRLIQASGWAITPDEGNYLFWIEGAGKKIQIGYGTILSLFEFFNR